MSRKQNVNSRTTYGIQNNRQHINSKENAKYDTYQLDPKIIQLKKKYQIETQKTESAYPPHLYGTRAPPSNLRQQQVFRKLQNIKSELKLIPDWQAFARSILFNEMYENTQKLSVVNQKQEKKSSQSYQIPRFGGNFFQNYNDSQQNFDRASVMNSSTVSFKVNHAKSIQKYEKKLDTVNTPIRNERNQSNLGEREKYYLKSDIGRRSQQKVDQKINEISRKIKESEQKKRNLGVEFIPFDKKKIQAKYDTPTQMYEQHSKNAQALLLKNSSIIENVKSRPPRPTEVSKFNEKSINQDYKEDFQSKSPRFAATPGKIEKLSDKNTIAPAEILQKKDKKDVYDSHPKGRNYSVNGKQRSKYNQKIVDEEKEKNSNTSRMLMQRVQQSLKQRKKKVENLENKKKSRQVTQKLVHAFCEQVELDEKFRNSKLWFKTYKNDKKFTKLKNLMEMQGIEMTEEKIMQDFAVQQKEDNPFFSVTSQTCDIDEVVRSYMESEKYWKKNLYKKFSKEALEGEDFNNLSIDLDKKGYIVLEDLVRFLNMETGKFFRNRDLYSIFRRLSKNSEKLNFNVFINAFYY